LHLKKFPENSDRFPEDGGRRSKSAPEPNCNCILHSIATQKDNWFTVTWIV